MSDAIKDTKKALAELEKLNAVVALAIDFNDNKGQYIIITTREVAAELIKLLKRYREVVVRGGHINIYVTENVDNYVNVADLVLNVNIVDPVDLEEVGDIEEILDATQYKPLRNHADDNKMYF